MGRDHTHRLGSLALPYELCRRWGDHYVITNRRGRPLGIHTPAHVLPESLPVIVRILDMTPAIAAELSHIGDDSTHRIQLCPGSAIYDDPAAMTAYLGRLARLATLKVAPADPWVPPGPDFHWIDRYN